MSCGPEPASVSRGEPRKALTVSGPQNILFQKVPFTKYFIIYQMSKKTSEMNTTGTLLPTGNLMPNLKASPSLSRMRRALNQSIML
jgi:hypothetical protein